MADHLDNPLPPRPAARLSETGAVARSHEAACRDAVQDLTQCGACGCGLVQPLDWHDAGRHHWRLTLRCPNCEATGTVVIEEQLVDHYDVELERGAAQLARQLEQLVSDRIDREVATFAAALSDGILLPEDF